MKTAQSHRAPGARIAGVLLALVTALMLQGCAYTASTAEDNGARGPFRSVNPTYPAHTWERPWYRVGY